MRMPTIFVGHGSPMNAIDDSEYSRGWRIIGDKIPKPKAILVISAHWETRGTRVNDSMLPKLVYDFYGFPRELYEVVYDVEGSPELAERVKSVLGEDVVVDNEWGIDHGAWSVLVNMFPEADVPVVELSMDRLLSSMDHFDLGSRLGVLRDEGYLILGSGNVVHNLGMVDFNMEGGYDWAVGFDSLIKDIIRKGYYADVASYDSGLSVPTKEHFWPLLYVLGAVHGDDRLEIFNEGCTMGSLAMTSYLFY